jgi:CubicO group peptidase (beta-lactamase class C family)
MKLTRRQIADAAALVESWIRYQAATRGVPAVCYAVSFDGELVLAGCRGVADIATGAPASADTAYRIASITKTFTATLVLQLVERGRVRLDEPVTAYLPWLRPAMADSGITVRHLLTHGGGVIVDGSCSWSGGDFPTRELLHRDVLARPTLAEPSAGFLYSNVAYALLGEVVEKVSGRTFRSVLNRGIARPLGLEASSTRLTPALRRSLATGYWRTRPGEGPRPAADGEAHAFEPAAGLVSNAKDLLRYQQGHMPGDTRILSELSKREMQRTQWQRSDEPHHGYGWMIWTVDGISVRGHSGGYPGFSTKIGFSPDLGIATAVLTNTLGPLPALAVDTVFHSAARVHACWDDAALPQTSRSGTEASLGRLAGRYRGDWGELHVAKVNHSLYLVDPDEDRPLRVPARLAPVGDDARFVIADNDDYGHRGDQVSFELDRAGRGAVLRYGPQRLTRVPLETP